MERHFDEELKVVKERLLYASGIAQQMISDSVKALTDRNENMISEIYKKEDKYMGYDCCRPFYWGDNTCPCR